MTSPLPITEADLHAWVDGQLAEGRAREVEAYLAARPEESARVEAWRAQKQELRALFDPVQDEPAPKRLLAAARPPRPRWYAQRLAAGIAIAVFSGALGWGLRDGMTEPGSRLAGAGTADEGSPQTPMPAFARRAAVAHAVYSPDQRRPVEVDAVHEDQLVAWLSKRMDAPMRPPHLQALGYALEGGRLLPGGVGPVAQFMYRHHTGSRMTLYVSRELADVGRPALSPLPNREVSFRFAREGGVNVFYWVDGPFGYALSTEADSAELKRVSALVYRQLESSTSSR